MVATRDAFDDTNNRTEALRRRLIAAAMKRRTEDAQKTLARWAPILDPRRTEELTDQQVEELEGSIVRLEGALRMTPHLTLLAIVCGLIVAAPAFLATSCSPCAGRYCVHVETAGVNDPVLICRSDEAADHLATSGVTP